MKKIEIPIVNNTVSAIFPKRCICCEKPAETLLKVPFSKKFVLRSMMIGDEEVELESVKYHSEFKIPYCIKHAKESEIIDILSMVLWLLSSLLFASAVIYMGYADNYPTSTMKWIGLLFTSLLVGAVMGIIVTYCFSSVLFVLKKHFLFTPFFVNARLGLKIKVDHYSKNFIFIFSNNNIAYSFAKLNKVELKHFGPKLHRAIIKGSIARVILLLLMGCDVNEKEKGLTPLQLAAEKGHRRIASLLIRRGANVNASINNVTPLHLALKNAHLDIVLLLIENGADINAKDSKGYTPLHLAAAAGDYAAAWMLIINGADVNSRSVLNHTPLHLAVAHGDLNIVVLLVDNNAEINCKSSDGRTPLVIAREKGDKTIAKVLTDKGG